MPRMPWETAHSSKDRHEHRLWLLLLENPRLLNLGLIAHFQNQKERSSSTEPYDVVVHLMAKQAKESLNSTKEPYFFQSGRSPTSENEVPVEEAQRQFSIIQCVLVS